MVDIVEVIVSLPVVVVFTVFHKTQRAKGGNTKMGIKNIDPAESLDELVNKNGRQFRFFGERIVDVTNALQPYGIGEGYARNRSAETTGVDPEYADARMLVGVVLAVESGERLHGFGAVVGVEQFYRFGDLPVGPQRAIEGNDVICKGHEKRLTIDG